MDTVLRQQPKGSAESHSTNVVGATPLPPFPPTTFRPGPGDGTRSPPEPRE